MRNHLSLLPVFILLLISCRSVGTVDEISNPVYLTDEHRISLLPTSAFPDEVEILQMIEGKYGETEYIMQTIVILSGQEVSVSAFSPLGNSVYDLLYRNGVASYDAVVDLPGSNALYMLADIQFCYYPDEDVKAMIESSGLNFDMRETDEGWIRTISNGDEPVIVITRKANRLEYINMLRQYEYLIEEL